MQTAWRLEFGRGVWIFVKFVDPAALGGILIGGVREPGDKKTTCS